MSNQFLKTRLTIEKTESDNEAIMKMMGKQFGYSRDKIAKSLEVLDRNVASADAWHSGNEFEAHLDPVGGIILTRLGAGINPDNSMHVDGGAAHFVALQLRQAESMAKSFAERDRRNGIDLADATYHYKSLVDMVISSHLLKSLGEDTPDERDRRAFRNQIRKALRLKGKVD